MIIRSIFDNDAYKYSMQLAVLRHCPGVPVRYVFNNRRPEGKFNQAFLAAFKSELNDMRSLAATNEEIGWLAEYCPWLDGTYRDYLRNYRYDPSEVSVQLINGDLKLDIAGTWERTILWEVPLMALISELYFIHCDNNWSWLEAEQEGKAIAKAQKLIKYRYADFGTRRRRSYATQDLVVKTMSSCENFFGTSNVHLAMKHNKKAIGTMAHEWIMGISALEGLRHANRHALRIWSKVYGGDLGIALTDTFGSKVFFEDFDGYLARLFDGVRHDSGDPFEFTDQVIAHYKSLGIDPKTRVIVFSDGLNTDLACRIGAYCQGRIMCSFGIGTHFTNDFYESQALNMVIKLAECNHVPVVKLSDTPSKAIGDKDALRVARWTFNGTPLDGAS